MARVGASIRRSLQAGKPGPSTMSGRRFPMPLECPIDRRACGPFRVDTGL
jgi:hypothetical protein